MCFHTICIFVALLGAPFYVDCISLADEAVKEGISKFSEYHCSKYDECQHDGHKVCGYDEDRTELAIFEDMCTLHKANCKKFGMYFALRMEICETKQKYQADYGDKFDWQPINRMPGVVKVKDIATSTPATVYTPYISETPYDDDEVVAPVTKRSIVQDTNYITEDIVIKGKTQMVEGTPNKYYLK